MRYRMLGYSIVEVRGLSLEAVSAAEWFAAMQRLGFQLQEQVADSFSKQKLRGHVWLLPNTKRWNKYKAERGLDPRRGHATNELQRNLDSPRPLFSISRLSSPKGEAAYRLTFNEGWLNSRVPHALHYAEMKARGGRLLVLARKWVDMAMAILHATDAEGRMRHARAAARAPRYIRPSLGLTQDFLKKITRGVA